MLEVGCLQNEATAAALEAVCNGLQGLVNVPARDLVSDLLLSRSAWLISQPWLHTGQRRIIVTLI
ncbi:hypothetical protein U9M48_020396 [Paspalum notatum var. saurae]|uniref:Uncharacterized protein n=1 Tax=Paspalum notatum var. saurae TaxID=547442 RepID=A0AAQ3TDA1_PASNO